MAAVLGLTVATLVAAAGVPASATPARWAESKAAPGCGPNDTPGRRWMQQVYFVLLGRCAEDAAARHGDAIVNDPGKRGAFTRGVVRSLESGYLWVGRWTRAYCNRAPGENEGRSYANKLAVTSPNDNPERWEYVNGLVFGQHCSYQRFGGTDESFVQTAYQLFIGRSASESDIAYWGGRNGLELALKLSQSSEGRRYRVRYEYQHLLGRTAHQGDIEYWSPRLKPGGGYDKLNLAAAIAASSEFVRRSQTLSI